MKKTLYLMVGALLLSSTFFAQKLSLEDIWKSGTYRQQSVYGLRSMNDGEHYTTMERGEDGPTVSMYSYETGEKVKQLISEGGLRDISGDGEATFESYQFSDDEKLMLLTYDVESIYRHSTQEKYWIVDLENRTARKLKTDGKQRHATISPDGSKVAYIEGNNIFVQDIKTQAITAVTTDGEWNKIINGFADWVYEEEFSFDKAFAWAPDGSRIAFYKTDESGVKEFNMQKFTGLYPEDYRYKYPKAGEDNSKVTIHVYDIASGKTYNPNLGDYEYIPRIKWTETSEFLAVMKMPRLQNQLEILLVETTNYGTRPIYKESSKTYIEIGDDLTFFGNNSGFIIKSEKNGSFQLYTHDFKGENEVQITNIDGEVHDFLGYDKNSSRVYFIGNNAGPYNTEVYSVSLYGGDRKRHGLDWGTNRASFSSTYEYFIGYHQSFNSPVEVTLYNSENQAIRELESNEKLKAKMSALSLSKVETFDFRTSEEVTLFGWMMKPSDFNPKKKYPVLMFVYGGPGSQTATSSMGGNYWWHQYLCEQGYIVVSIDNRGTGGRGRDFRTQTYGQLGNLESKDQIEGAKWLAKQSYVDGSRIGIWGWSYGGYMSSLCLFKGSDVFKAAIAVAPVTNWRFYDSIYTERYMGLPQDNAKGYDDNSPINHVDGLKGKYLLIHGTGDDNVHYQNSVEMVDALIAADKQFDFMMYPERNHGIYGGNTRYHLFTKMTDFILENL